MYIQRDVCIPVLPIDWQDFCCQILVHCTEAIAGAQDTVPAESSVISTLLAANNKATGINFFHM